MFIDAPVSLCIYLIVFIIKAYFSRNLVCENVMTVHCRYSLTIILAKHNSKVGEIWFFWYTKLVANHIRYHILGKINCQVHILRVIVSLGQLAVFRPPYQLVKFKAGCNKDPNKDQYGYKSTQYWLICSLTFVSEVDRLCEVVQWLNQLYSVSNHF